MEKETIIWFFGLGMSREGLELGLSEPNLKLCRVQGI